MSAINLDIVLKIAEVAADWRIIIKLAGVCNEWRNAIKSVPWQTFISTSYYELARDYMFDKVDIARTKDMPDEDAAKLASTLKRARTRILWFASSQLIPFFRQASLKFRRLHYIDNYDVESLPQFGDLATEAGIFSPNSDLCEAMEGCDVAYYYIAYAPIKSAKKIVLNKVRVDFANAIHHDNLTHMDLKDSEIFFIPDPNKPITIDAEKSAIYVPHDCTNETCPLIDITLDDESYLRSFKATEIDDDTAEQLRQIIMSGLAMTEP